jgi:Subtilisin inhibitor-like
MRMKPDMPRARAGARYLISAAACAAVITACGSAAAPAGSHPAAASHPAAKPARISLDISVSGIGAKAEHWTLTCDPAGGTHPDPAAACRVLLKAKDPFGPLPRGVMCPMMLAGAKTAVVSGTWFGKRVSITLRQGGCDLERWAEVGQIFN